MLAAPATLFAQPGVVFDVDQSGLFDKTDKAYLIENVQISLTTDVKSLHPTEPGWNRRFVLDTPREP